MKRTFIHLPNFDKSWDSMKLTDSELMQLESLIMQQPDKGELIQGTGGLRKIRVGRDSKGKSGGVRVLYVDFEHYARTYCLFAYPKNVLETITDQQKKMFKKLIDTLLSELKNKKKVKR